MGRKAKKSQERKNARGRQSAAVPDTAPYAERESRTPGLLTPVRSPVKGVKRVVNAMTCVRVGDSPVHGQGLFATASIGAGTDLILDFELFPPKEIAWMYQQLTEQGMISGEYVRQVPLIVHMLMLPECKLRVILAYYHSCDIISVHPFILEQVSSILVQYVRDFVHRPHICSRVWVSLCRLTK
jgi:hypothetical protein